MNNVLNTIEYIYFFNKKLIMRTSKGKMAYLLMVVFFTLLLSSISVVGLINGFESCYAALGMNFITLYLNLFIIIELLLISYKYVNDVVLIPSYFICFPISDITIYFYILFGMLFDIKLTVFFIPILIILISIVVKTLLSALIILISLIILYLVVEIWLINIYLFGNKFFTKNKKDIQIIPIILINLFVILNISNRFDFYEKIPIISNITNSVIIIDNGSMEHVIFYIGDLILLIVVGLFVGKTIHRKRIFGN